MIIEKLIIEFGQPEHGWLPVDFKHGDFSLHFMASDVPVNPIDQLIYGIRQITKSIATEVWWHLEPAGYYFEFENEKEEYKLKITFRKSNSANKEFIYEVQGKYEDIIMPFYRSLKKFMTYTIYEPHWPKTDKMEIEILTGIVKGS